MVDLKQIMMVMMWLPLLVLLGLVFLVPVNIKFRLGKPVVFSFLLRRLDANIKKTPCLQIPYSYSL